MNHHGHHHHGHHREEQIYGAYPGSNAGYYEAASYPPQAPAYGYEQQGYGGYRSPQPSAYGGGGAMQPYGGYGSAQPSSYGGAIQSFPEHGRMESVDQLYAQEQKHKHNDHRAEAIALGAAPLAAYEHHQMKVDPQHAARHHREEQIAEATAVGAAGYALYENQQVRHDDQQLQAAGFYPEHGRKHEKKHDHGLLH